MRADALDYELPEGLIADAPLPDRDGARLLVMDRFGKGLLHSGVRELGRLLPPALFVVNDTRVIPARLFGEKPSGGKAEFLLIERLSPAGSDELWLALGRTGKGFREGMRVRVGNGALDVTVTKKHEDGHVELRIIGEKDVLSIVEDVGEIPLPPYIRRAPSEADKQRYQTLFAREPGAVAAPTAGLHFSAALIDSLKASGHAFATVTLHVGPGTFMPLRSDDLTEHVMHAERYSVSEETATAIRNAKAEGRPVVAVGTTVVRTLEAVAKEFGEVRASEGATSIFIYPPYAFRVVDALFTNFHLPRSTLLALVMAFAGEENVRAAYAEAVRERYRFFSYGDAMLLRPAVL
ncbi:MAG: tRNA preQ1(34) S-adenosylmethionine ribosyltransferase-isomerase QueA [Sandaracinaceae bacterium]|jgi:S-adenosylmethionine:tRNA ribosyltransferase-isomerase|nr:tRNA preQ1(34) S-adenosylmethionine ribosyltransferase-isomerase QueA [Sandaracinaceae bacterium]